MMSSNRDFHNFMKNTYLSPYEEEYSRQLLRLQEVMSKGERINKLIVKQIAMSQDLQCKFSHLSTSPNLNAFTRRLTIAQCVLLCKQIKNLTSKIKREITI